ncbi:MAG: hypothetical protein ACRYFS_01080 [Janthinobacterium lividum]
MTRFSLCAAAGLLLAFLLPSPANADPPTAPDTPAAAVVRQFLADRTDGKYAAAYALLSSGTQEVLPFSQVPDLLKQVLGPTAQTSADALPLIALLLDFHNTLHFKFRVLSASEDDPTVVLVRAYQVGRPLSTVKTIRIATTADPNAGGAWRVAGKRTGSFITRKAVRNIQQTVSQSNLKQIALGIIQYAQGHDETMPDAATWVDEIMPYVKSEAIFHDPSSPDSQTWSYAYNRALSHQPLAALDYPAHTVLLFESSLGVKNASDTGQSVPMPGRHISGTDYVTADGHVQWFADGTALSYKLNGK